METGTSCYCTTSSDRGVCYVPEGSTSAEHLCGRVLLHHHGFYTRFLKIHFTRCNVEKTSFKIEVNVSKSDIQLALPQPYFCTWCFCDNISNCLFAIFPQTHGSLSIVSRLDVVHLIDG